MKSFLATAFLLGAHTDATLEETSLMQGLMERHSKLSIVEGSKHDRHDATAKLMETATKMMKNGVTPDVVTFIETTITEINANVLGQIVDEHTRDQALIDALLARFQLAVDAMEAACAQIQILHNDREDLSTDHKQCRSYEALHCARSRRCEEELERAWIEVKIQEEEMRRIHWEIHGEWCLGNAPDHPGLANPWHWTLTEYKEGAETSQSVQPYPAIDLADDVVDFRTFSVSHFGEYIVQLPKVQRAWQLYAEKLDECARLEFTLETQIESCDDKQILLHDKACEHSAEHRLGTSTHAREYHDTMVAYTAAVETIQQLEFDRKREWETLRIVTCLLETVYTHVITAIDSGEPCPTTESHPNQTESEINYCHVIEESLTANLTIDYGNPPPLPECNLTAEPPCTAEYIWDEHGMFPLDIQTTHSAALAADPGLDAYFTTLSLHGWAGCAAPRACIPCEGTDVVDGKYEGVEVCKGHQTNLYPGQLDFDTFKCLSGDQCIMAGGRCNGFVNCDDGSDEIGCDTTWGLPAVMQSEVCRDPFVSDIQFRCADGSSCTHIEGRCNGVSNCADGSDESGCSSGTTGLTGEATTGREFVLEVPALHSSVFFDREYTFDSFGGLSGMTYLKMSNEDKHTRHSHVQMKLRLPHPLTVYVVKLTDHELPWLHQERWAVSSLEGVSYHGARETRHKEWSGILEDDFYGPGVVYQKTFPAGTVEMRGNHGGDGSYLIFLGNPMSTGGGFPTQPPVCCEAMIPECLGCQAGMTGEEYCAGNPIADVCFQELH